ncbi:hypothetical protein JOD54_006651 [Actinokineospora baliensis]|uniref:hypothetical protein n=1 Tax=Actinokineospora baliensis TaxID=547056 RepID=UPI00195DFC34|nr:hypothetical protein [Actinokineospora baliensis]MBM7776447.1 hypothetical protein [Actinokineospora baliensis]
MGFLSGLRTAFSRQRAPGLNQDDPDLAVVAACFDDAEAASAALTRSSDFRPTDQAVLRHHLSLPADRVDEAAAIVAQDGYALREVLPHDGAVVTVYALRVRVVDALECSRERSRMASLAARLGGRALGWDVLQSR